MSDVNSKSGECRKDIFKMNDYCYEDLFDWLSLADLKALRATCKQMKQLVNNYIKRNYPKALRTILINDVRLERLNGIESTGGFELINHVIFQSDRFNLARIQGVKHILSEAENIEVDCELPDCDFYEVFLKHCTRMKHLMIRRRSYVALFYHGRSRNWLNQHYPMLETIGIVNLFNGHTLHLECHQLVNIFERNPKVRTFSTTLDFICENKSWLLKSGIKLDRLDVWISSKTDNDFDDAFNILNKLHQRDAYQRLHFYIDEEYKREEYHQVASLPAIELLAFLIPENFWSVEPKLTSLKELILDTEPFTEDLEVLAKSFPEIRRICVTESRIDQVLPFIQRCPKLHQIKIQAPWMDAYADEDGTIDLLALHNERTKLANAWKVTIFVPEYVFLKNKWKQQIELGLVELKRDHLWKQSNPFFELYLE